MEQEKKKAETSSSSQTCQSVSKCPKSCSSSIVFDVEFPALCLPKENKPLKVGSHNNNSKRVWDKRHMCVYCEKLFSKLSKHLLRKHIEEIDVAHAFSFKKCSKERKQLLLKITKQGDFKFNTQAMNSGHGELIAAKRPKRNSDISEFTTCENCLGLYKKHDLWRHKKSCNISLKSHSRNIDPILTTLSHNQTENEYLNKKLSQNW